MAIVMGHWLNQLGYSRQQNSRNSLNHAFRECVIDIFIFKKQKQFRNDTEFQKI